MSTRSEFVAMIIVKCFDFNKQHVCRQHNVERVRFLKKCVINFSVMLVWWQQVKDRNRKCAFCGFGEK